MSEATDVLSAVRDLVETVHRGAESKLAETLAPLATAVLEEIHEQRVFREVSRSSGGGLYADPRAQTMHLAEQFVRVCRDLGLDPKDTASWTKVKELGDLMSKE